jgi:hypothetical protein
VGRGEYFVKAGIRNLVVEFVVVKDGGVAGKEAQSVL